MTKEAILRQIDEYEREVEGKVSKAAFPYPPMRSGIDAVDAVAWATHYEMTPVEHPLSEMERVHMEHIRRMAVLQLKTKLEQQLFLGPNHIVS